MNKIKKDPLPQGDPPPTNGTGKEFKLISELIEKINSNLTDIETVLERIENKL